MSLGHVTPNSHADNGPSKAAPPPQTPTFISSLIGFAVCEQICKTNMGQNMNQRATSDTMLMSQMFSPFCDCHCICSMLLTFWCHGAEPS